MKHISMIVGATVLFGAAGAQSAAVSYDGAIALTPPVTLVTGSVGGFGYNRESAADVDFWSFSGMAGNTVSIQVTRISAALDPVMDLYFGQTTADESLFRTQQSWGGLQFLASSDDVLDPPSGPFGDPYIASFTLPSTGIYTVAIGGGASDGEGPFSYSLSLHVQAVPEPASALLLAVGAAALGLHRRSSRRA